MRLMIYGINYFPEIIGIGKYTGEMAEWLAQRGHQVDVIAAPPYYPDWKIMDGYSGWNYRTEEGPHSITITRCPVWIPGSPNGLQRIVHLASFAVSSGLAVLWRAGRRRPDVIVVIAPALFCAPAAWLAARLSGAKCWLHIQDFEVDAAYSLGILRKGPIRRLADWFERRLVSAFDRTSTITRRMVRHLLSKGSVPDRTVLFENWVDVQAIRPVPAVTSFREELRISRDTTVALYSGNMGKKQGIEDLAKVARDLVHRTDIAFVFCGNGVTRPELEKGSADLPNVRFLDLQPKERLNDLLNLADIHLLPQRAEAADLLMPCKLTGMMASGGAIVATADTDTEIGDVLTGRGVLACSGDHGALADAIVALAGDCDRRDLLGRKAREYAETHLATEPVLRNFEKALLALVRNR